jgi:hypothetical protein
MAPVNEAGDAGDPAELVRLRAELAYVTAPQRLGFVVAALGLAAAILRATALPALPRAVAVVLIATALGLFAIGTIRRIRWHRRRMRGR